MTPNLASHCWLYSILIDRTKEVSVVGQNTRLMNKNKTHCNGGLSPLPCQRFKKKETSMEAAVEFKHPLFQLERNTKHNGRIFTRYPVNASENCDFNKSFLANTMLTILTRATEKTKRSWTYMREKGMDSPYLFLLEASVSLASPTLFLLLLGRGEGKVVWCLSSTMDLCTPARTAIAVRPIRLLRIVMCNKVFRARHTHLYSGQCWVACLWDSDFLVCL